MISNRTGRICDDFHVLGHTWSPVYLLDGQHPVLFEAGFACLGRVYEQAIKGVLGPRLPSLLFLTHVHYDHCGATSYLTRAFPGLQVAASAYAADIIKRPNAQDLIRKLSENIILLISDVHRDDLIKDPFEPFTVDIILEHDQMVEVGPDVHVQVLSAPGHTRDLLAFYITEPKILIGAEAVGGRDWTGHVFADFLVDYDDYLGGLQRMAALDIEVLCQAHHFVYTGKSVKEHFAQAIASAQMFRNRVEELLRNEAGSVDRVVARIKAEEYDRKPSPKQPEKAYVLNLASRVTHLARKLGWTNAQS
jgi:glyoxylase-like metal-dependent hydrolase (beta-lactamase superfamily II)